MIVEHILDNCAFGCDNETKEVLEDIKNFDAAE